MTAGAGYILAVAKHRDDVFAALFFDGLPPALRARVRILEFGNDALDGALAAASAVIVMRHGLFSFGRLASAAGWARVPRYYFLDDNLLLLRHEPEMYGPYWAAYTPQAVRRALRGFSGVLLASRTLVQYFEEQSLHPRAIEYPPIAGGILSSAGDRDAARPLGGPFRIAFFGGEHRRQIFADLVYPAARQLASQFPVELIVAGIDAARLPDPGADLRVVPLPYDLRYRDALAKLAQHRPHVLAHPTPASRNNVYRNANILINARAVGAAAVLSNVAPYDTLPSPQPALLCGNDIDEWYGAFAHLAEDERFRQELWRRTSQFCEEHFSGRINAAVIQGILESHTAPDPLTRAYRRVVAGPPLRFDRVIVNVKRLARRSALIRSAATHVRHRTA